MRVAVLGRTQILWNAIALLEKSGHQIVLIGTSKAAPEYTVGARQFEEKAKKLRIPFFNTGKINSDEIVDEICSVHADIAISINWVTVIGQRVIDCFKYGILNAHMGDLPRYRGNACPNWAIINGEKRIGISIHYMVADELDAGDILLKEFYPLKEDTNITEIYRVAERRIPELFLKAIDKIASGDRKVVCQSKNSKDILRCYPRIPSDSCIDWNESCEAISRKVRASCAPFDGAYTYFGEYRIRILQCSVQPYPSEVLVVPGQVVLIDRSSDRIGVAAQDGIIVIEKASVDYSQKKLTELVVSIRSRMNYSVQDKLYELERRIEDLEGR